MKEKKTIMQANEQQLIILQSISNALILIKGLKDERWMWCPLFLCCSALSCPSIIPILVYANTNMMIPKPGYVLRTLQASKSYSKHFPYSCLCRIKFLQVLKNLLSSSFKVTNHWRLTQHSKTWGKQKLFIV